MSIRSGVHVSKYSVSLFDERITWDPRVYCSLVQASLLYDIRYSHRPLLKKLVYFEGEE